MDPKKFGTAIKDAAKNKIMKVAVDPVNNLVDASLTDIFTTVGAFVIRSIDGKLRRSITFTTGVTYGDRWMEEALYGILYTYNNIKASPKLELTNKKGFHDGTGMYYQLNDGMHNLKYRGYDIMLVIQSNNPTSITGRVTPQKMYTVITYNLDPNFVSLFERDMIAHRNSLLKIRADSPTVNVFQDLHESDGYTYWEKTLTIPKRKMRTIFLPYEKKKIIVDTINEFFANREYYRENGISHNLKILLYGPPGTGKDSIAKMIASEWGRNIFYVTGGKDGRFIPNAITDDDDDVNYPLFIISDIDKYPYLINEPEVIMAPKEKGEDGDKSPRDDTMKYKQLFGNMINALDGVLSGEDRIIIMTTNHIEKFSDTFLRPGRIDLKMEIGYVIPDVFRQFVKRFYNYELPEGIKLSRDDITVAEMLRDHHFMKLTLDEFLDKYLKGSKKK